VTFDAASPATPSPHIHPHASLSAGARESLAGASVSTVSRCEAGGEGKEAAVAVRVCEGEVGEVLAQEAAVRSCGPLAPRVLVVAGSDSGGGAGVQADIKACMACGAFATTAVTALTAQNSQGVVAVHVPPTDTLRAQLAAVLDDIGTDVVKTGMLPDAASVHAVADELTSRWHGPGAAGKPPGLRLVVDPVLVATSGDALAGMDVCAAILERLVPLATVLTPNVAEAAALLGVRLRCPCPPSALACFDAVFACKPCDASSHSVAA
jgi:hypothetical protein